MQAEELYFLLKPFCELGSVSGRTRVQKIFYLLQSIGYPTELEYFLHYYGPYSEDLTSFLGYACSAGFLRVTPPIQVGVDSVRFDYFVTDAGKEMVTNLESKVISQAQARKAAEFLELARELNSKPPDVLELAATILYFRNERGCDLKAATEKTKAMKPQKAGDPAVLKAAQELLAGIAQSAG